MKIFRKQYEPIKKDLPLFSLKPEYLSKIFKDSGFGTVSITRMEDFCKFEKEKDSLFDKHDSSDPIYFIKAEK